MRSCGRMRPAGGRRPATWAPAAASRAGSRLRRRCPAGRRIRRWPLSASGRLYAGPPGTARRGPRRRVPWSCTRPPRHRPAPGRSSGRRRAAPAACSVRRCPAAAHWPAAAGSCGPSTPGVAIRSYPLPCTNAAMTCSNTTRSGHPAAVAAQRVTRMKRRALPADQRAQNSTQTGSSRHDGTTGTGHLDDHGP